MRIYSRFKPHSWSRMEKIQVPETTETTIFIERKPPEGNFGKDGDLYVDVSSFDLIEKKDGKWL
jgi:hypothetical protein